MGKKTYDTQLITALFTSPDGRSSKIEVDFNGDKEKEVETVQELGNNFHAASIGKVAKTNTSKAITLGQLSEQYIQERIEAGKINSRNGKTALRYKNFTDTAIEFFCQRTIDQISTDDCKDYYKTLQSLPANRKKIKKIKNLTLQKQASLTGYPTLSYESYTAHFNFLSTLFELAVDYGYIDRNPCNAVVRQKNRTISSSKRDIFTHDELRTLFSHPHFREGKWKSPSTSNQTYRFWLPILAALTGARIGELCDLHTDDLKQENEIYYLEISDDYDPATKKQTKYLKTLSSKRKIPLHSTLIELGFLEFVKKQKTKLIFHVQNSGQDKAGKSDPNNAGKTMNRLLKKVGIHVNNEKVFHSFRHTFITDLSRQNADLAIAASLTGHLNEAEARIAPEYSNTYNKGFTIEQKKEVIEMLSYANYLKIKSI